MEVSFQRNNFEIVGYDVSLASGRYAHEVVENQTNYQG